MTNPNPPSNGLAQPTPLVRLLQQERRDRRTDSDAHEMVTVPCDHRIS
jgi:hypothetical protein